ncbi:MAG: SIMPL domain-containing protein [Patescibacteria group bacterium]
MDKAKKYFWYLLDTWIAVAVLGMLFAGFPAISRYGNSLPAMRTLTVSADGKVLAIPDIAESSFSVIVQGQNPQALANNSNEKMSAVIEFLKSSGVDPKDIKTTSYNLSPDYRYDENIRRNFIVGYTLSQTVTVKVREMGKIADIVAGLTPLGVNQIGGINFTIDDQEAYLSGAREEAFDKAREKAKSIARASGVRLGRVVNVSESGGYPPIPYYAKGLEAGFGGDAVAAPTIEPGSQEVQVSVSITYELR